MKSPIVSCWLFTLALLFPALSAGAQDSPDTMTEFTEQMQHQPGFFSFYHATQQGKFYLQIPRNGEQFIFQTSLPWGLGSNDIGLDRGQLGATRLASFHIEGDKVLLLQHNTQFRANSTNAAERASIEQAFAASVIAGFTVVASNADSILIDYTPFLLSDTHGVITRLEQSQQGSFKLAPERSVVYPPRSKAFVDNTELEAKVTFTGRGTGAYLRSVAADADHLTLHLHHSFIRLPDNNYQPRAFHPQSGFWAHQYLDYAAPLGQSMRVQVIPRHRFDGSQPIIYYLDPGVPEPVRSALLDGGRWWSQAFAAIGYPDGFQVRELPADADPMDVRYNVIQWVHRSTRGWSYGASIIDPRSGEILKGHVTLGSLRVRQDMLIAQGLLAPYQADLSAEQQQQLVADIEAMALARIRQLSAHEIGHTLGIAHNFAASSHDRASVMDYPHPLVSLNLSGDGIRLADAYTEGLGLWDQQVVAYGYGTGDAAAVLGKNRQLGLSFISDSDARAVGGGHPDAHLWDNGSDAVTELERILAVRQQVLANFSLANLAPNEPVSRLQQVLVPMYLLHRYQVEAAVKMIAGVHYDYAVNDGSPLQLRPVNAAQQQRALNLMTRTLSAEQLRLPASIMALLTPVAYGEDSNDRERFKGLTGLFADADSMAASSARFSLQLLLHPQRLERLAQQRQLDSAIPSVSQVLKAMAEQSIQPAYAANADSLQVRLAFESLTAVVESYLQPHLSASVKAPLFAFLQQQQNSWQQAPASAHRDFALHALTQLWQHQQWPLQAAPALPPGSPI
jgi:hypothetical protein